MLHSNLGINEQGHLTVGGVDAVSLAERYGTPLYVLDEDVIRAKCRTYVYAMQECFGAEATPLYASKALCFKGIYPIVASEGLAVDVVSPGEIYTALAAGFPAEQMFFHGSNKTDADIRYGIESGVGIFVVDNLNELAALDRIAGELGCRQPVMLRLTVGLDPHTLAAITTGKVDSQFGVPIDTGQAEEFVLAALKCEHVRIDGFHSHVGSQVFESDSFMKQIEILIRFAADMRAKYHYTATAINIGGGFAVRYVESDPEIDIAARIAEISVHLRDACEEYNYPLPVIYMEPGRSIVADAGVTLYTTGGVKEVNGYRNYITIDGGMADNPRFALYGAKYTVLNASRISEPAEYECTVAGRACESGDRIAEDVKIARPERGDVIAVLSTGAYNYSMASNYNRLPRPATVIVSGGQDRLAVRRESFEDLIRNEL
ncbi:MAG: diaminopimelate decarboxylase [Mogibacterium sp.]|nr:diaminopimelate decarboxylase [Mogibacterium sp.]